MKLKGWGKVPSQMNVPQRISTTFLLALRSLGFAFDGSNPIARLIESSLRSPDMVLRLFQDIALE